MNKKLLFLLFLILAIGVAFSHSQIKVKPTQLQVLKSIKVLSPNGGESWLKGNNYTIRWQSHGISGNVKIKLKWGTSSGGWFNVINSTPNNGNYFYHVPSTGIGQEGNQFKIYVMTLDEAVKDESDGFFTLVTPPSIRVNYPNGGETWYKSRTYSIRWTSSRVNQNIKVLLKRDNGNFYSSNYSNNTSNDGLFNWKVSKNTPSGNYKVQVKTVDDSVMDESNSSFSISVYAPSALELSPRLVFIGKRGSLLPFNDGEGKTLLIPRNVNSYKETGIDCDNYIHFDLKLTIKNSDPNSRGFTVYFYKLTYGKRLKRSNHYTMGQGLKTIELQNIEDVCCLNYRREFLIEVKEGSRTWINHTVFITWRKE